MGVDSGAYDAQYVHGPQIYPSSSATASTSAAPNRRKRKVPDNVEVIDLTGDSPPKKRKAKDATIAVTAKKTATSPSKEPNPVLDYERRLRRWRPRPPLSYEDIRARALTQRMFVLDRQRGTATLNYDPFSSYPTETVSLAGTTGNIYTITIDTVPACDCPHARKGNQCKHIIYVMTRVLRAPDHLHYQLALLSSELKEIFARAPPLPSQTADASQKDGNRKKVEGECPICCVDFEPEGGEEVVYCKAACGNNVHRECFAQWAATKRGGQVTCPFCRAPWEGEGVGAGVKNMAKSGKVNGEGYVNVASQLGLSGRRDYSTYNDFWMRQRVRRGDVDWDADPDGYVGYGY